MSSVSQELSPSTSFKIKPQYIKANDVLTSQESPIKKRRRGRQSVNSNPARSPASLSSAAVLKAGTPNYCSPVMKVSPSSSAKAKKIFNNNIAPTPKTSLAFSFSKRQLTPVTRKLFAVKEESETRDLSHIEAAFDGLLPKKSHFKTPRSRTRNRFENRLDANHNYHQFALNSSPALKRHTVFNPKSEILQQQKNELHCQRADNNNNSFLVDPNTLLSSPIFASARGEVPLHHDFFSSPIANNKLVDSFEIQSAAEKPMNNSFNFSSIIQSSPLYHGYYLHSTPGSASTNRTVSDSSHYYNNNGNDLVRLAVRPMVMKPEIPSEPVGYCNDDSDESTDYEDFRDSKKQRVSSDSRPKQARKPLLPPVSISNLEFSSSDEDDDMIFNAVNRGMTKSSPARGNSTNSGWRKNLTSRRPIHSKKVGLTIDSSGRAVLALSNEESRESSFVTKSDALSPASQSGIDTKNIISPELSQHRSIGNVFSEETHNKHYDQMSLKATRMHTSALNSSPFIDREEEQQINELIFSTGHLEHLPEEPLPAFLDQENFANRYFTGNHIGTDETIESDNDDEALLQHILSSEQNTSMMTITNNTLPKGKMYSHINQHDGNYNDSFDADTSEEAIEPCDARVALMRTLNKAYY